MKRLGIVLTIVAGITAACRREPAPPASYPGAPVILISIDTLRADHLPCYGYHGIETPHIDRLCADSVLFENAYSHAPLTLPSHASLFTGEIPPENGVRNNIGYALDASKHETIASALRAKGYATGAAVSAYVMRASTGLGSSFDFYDDQIETRGGEAQGEAQRRGVKTVAVAKRWLSAHSDRPFFFFLHLYEPHAPYEPPEPYRSRYPSAYDGEIATADAITGDFIADLKMHGIYDRAIIILLSDHGEGLMQHGEQEHGIFVYREALHVPLMLKLPHSQFAKRRIHNPVALIDVYPTLLSLLGINSSHPLRGASLLDADSRPPRAIYSETLYPRIHLGWSELRSLIDVRYHLIQAPHAEVYDVLHDPAERNNLIGAERRVYASMSKELASYGTKIDEPRRIDPEEAKKLAALGYLAAPTQASGPLPDPKDHIADMADVREAARLEDRGDAAGAIARYRVVLERNPRFTDAWVLLAKAEEKRGRLDAAIDSYKRAVQLAPALASDFMLPIARLYLESGRPGEAERHAALAPAGADADVVLAQALTAQSRYDEAAAVLDRAEQRGGGKAVPRLDFARGDLLARRGRIEEAKLAFRREIAVFPRERRPYANLAILLFVEGDRDGARQTLESLVKADDSRASYMLAAKTLDELGDRSVASAFRARARRFALSE